MKQLKTGTQSDKQTIKDQFLACYIIFSVQVAKKHDENKCDI